MERLDALAAQRVLRTKVTREDFLYGTDEGPINVVHTNDFESLTRFSVCLDRFRYAKNASVPVKFAEP